MPEPTFSEISISRVPAGAVTVTFMSSKVIDAFAISILLLC
jgi:hypothetical protein